MRASNHICSERVTLNSICRRVGKPVHIETADPDHSLPLVVVTPSRCPHTATGAQPKGSFSMEPRRAGGKTKEIYPEAQTKLNTLHGPLFSRH